MENISRGSCALHILCLSLTADAYLGLAAAHTPVTKVAILLMALIAMIVEWSALLNQSGTLNSDNG